MPDYIRDFKAMDVAFQTRVKRISNVTNLNHGIKMTTHLEDLQLRKQITCSSQIMVLKWALHVPGAT